MLVFNVNSTSPPPNFFPLIRNQFQVRRVRTELFFHHGALTNAFLKRCVAIIFVSAFVYIQLLVKIAWRTSQPCTKTHLLLYGFSRLNGATSKRFSLCLVFLRTWPVTLSPGILLKGQTFLCFLFFEKRLLKGSASLFACPFTNPLRWISTVDRHLSCSTCVTSVPIHWQFSQHCYLRLFRFALNTQSPPSVCGYYWLSWPFLPLINK